MKKRTEKVTAKPISINQREKIINLNKIICISLKIWIYCLYTGGVP
jgi:hypothetical protein